MKNTEHIHNIGRIKSEGKLHNMSNDHQDDG